MILSRPDLEKAVVDREVVFDPVLEQEQWGEASVDLRLGFDFTMLQEATGATFSVAKGLGTIGQSGLWKQKRLREKDEFEKPESFVIEPGEFVLALTHETVSVPNHLIGLVEGRSTYARVGLTMHQTAPWIQPGWSGQITLEIRNSGPLKIQLTPILDRPCQLTFFRLTAALSEDEAYGSKPGDVYQHQASVLPDQSA